MSNLDVFADQKYINLETYKKNGQAVQTVVWFVIDDGTMYVVTRDQTGKVKRLRNNSDVRIAPCKFKGELLGEWVSAKAEFASDEQSKKAIKLRKKKYGFAATLAGVFSRTKGNLIVFSIHMT